MIVVLSCSCLWPIHWSQVLSWEWRCSWSSANRRCSNYIWEINNCIANSGALEVWQYVLFMHDEVMIWKLFLHYWPFVRRIQWPRVDSPQKGPVMWSLDVFFLEQTVELLVIFIGLMLMWYHCNVYHAYHYVRGQSYLVLTRSIS